MGVFKKIIMFYLLGIISVLVFILTIYCIDYIRYGYIWEATNTELIKSCFIFAFPMGIATYFISMTFKK